MAISHFFINFAAFLKENIKKNENNTTMATYSNAYFYYSFYFYFSK